ncbi:MAG: hypothetical protein QXP91_09570 [Candidatus Methanomethylicia archaeon]
MYSSVKLLSGLQLTGDLIESGEINHSLALLLNIYNREIEDGKERNL